MAEHIEREAFIEAKRKQYCADCDRRKGMKNGKMRFCYEIGEAPCRACYVDDLLTDVEDFPAADVVAVRHGNWIHREDFDYVDNKNAKHWHGMCDQCGFIHDFLDCHTGQYNYCPNYGAKMDGGADDAAD